MKTGQETSSDPYIEGNLPSQVPSMCVDLLPGPASFLIDNDAASADTKPDGSAGVLLAARCSMEMDSILL